MKYTELNMKWKTKDKCTLREKESRKERQVKLIVKVWKDNQGSKITKNDQKARLRQQGSDINAYTETQSN